MSKLKALLLTQGMHGMISQVEGLAKALNLNYKHQEIKLKKFWEFIPPLLTPTSINILETQFVFEKLQCSEASESYFSHVNDRFQSVDHFGT